jgi:D-sedoheptulose 7-phosphate isomerase
MDYKSGIKAYIEREIEILKALDTDAINAAMNLLSEAFTARKYVYIFGNGGSAATASHFVNDFNKGVYERSVYKPRFICLSDNTSTLTAIANDIGYEETYRFQLRDRIAPGDLVIAISGSGNSPNVINAVEYAKSLGNKIIGITGYSGGKLLALSDVSLHAPVDSMQITEDIHMIFDHMMMSVFCNK